MEDKDYNFATLSFFDMRTGEKVHEFEKALPTIVPEMSADAEPLYHFSGDLSLTIGDCDTTELWEKLVVGNSKNTTVEFDGYAPNGLVQARTHKKRRINKKWLKRYGMKLGYKKVHGKMLDCKAENFPDRVEISSNSITFQ